MELFEDYLDRWLKNIRRYQLERKGKERKGRHSFGFSDHEVQSRSQAIAKIMLNSLWGNIQGGKGRVYHKQQKGKKFVASLTNLLGPTTLIRSLGALERTLSVFRHRLRHFNQSFLRDQPTTGKFSRPIQR